MPTSVIVHVKGPYVATVKQDGKEPVTLAPYEGRELFIEDRPTGEITGTFEISVVPHVPAEPAPAEELDEQ